MIGDAVARALEQLGKLLTGCLKLLGNGRRHTLDGALNLGVQARQFRNALTQGMQHIGFHGLHGLTKGGSLHVQLTGGLRQNLDLGRNVFGESLHFVQQDARHLLHAAGLAADLIAHHRRPGGHLVDGAGQFVGRILQAVLQGGKGSLSGIYDPVEMMSVFLEPSEQGGGFRTNDEACLLKRLPLAFETGNKGADTFLVAAESALDRGHLLVHHLFKLPGALDGRFDSADQETDLVANCLSHR